MNGWETGEAQELGMNPKQLRLAEEYASKELPKLLSLLVIRKGRLVLERYYQGTSRETLMDVRSVTKSFTATAVGSAIHEKRLEGIHVSLAELLPRVLELGREEWRELTLRHLLTMTSGLYWRTGNKLGEKYIYRLQKSPDWLRFILRLPIVKEQLGHFQYRSPDSHLLSCIVTQATGSSASEYLRTRLFEPLGIHTYEWPADPQGNSAGHVFLRMSARDLAKLGWLYVRQGSWNGHRVVDESWVLEGTKPQSEGMQAFGQYGFHWWNSVIGGRRAFYALGHGGQFIFGIPGDELVVVTTADPKVSRWKNPKVLLERFILPSLDQGEAGKDRLDMEKVRE